MKQVTTLRKKANRKHAKKELSIHEISPAWAKILPMIPRTNKQEFYTNNQKLDISDCKFCVVGEAYGFKDDYSHFGSDDFCYDCYSCAVNFGYNLLLPQAEREGFVNNFVEHWNQSHV